MSLNDVMSHLMDSARAVTGLTQKLSVDDLTGYLVGLFPINYIDSPSDEAQTYPTDNGIWGNTYWTATLDKGIYTFSVMINSSTKSQVSTRCQFNTGKSNEINTQSNSWGWAGSTSSGGAEAGENKLIFTTFEVTKAGSFDFGLSGNPWTGGEVTAEKAMINKGYRALPFTKNKLGGVAKALLCALLPVRGCAA